MPNFSSLAFVEVAEEFSVVVGGWCGGVVEHLADMSNSSCFRVAFSRVELIYVDTET